MSRVRRVAVVGSGPSGLYTVAALTSSDRPVAVDVLDRLPTPYGLVRYGVAPDHARMKAVSRVLSKPFVRDDVRFLGNVEVGRDVTHDELTSHYDAVVYASGTEQDRGLGIPGEHYSGCVGAGELVRWYNGHPDASPFDASAAQVAVIGAGNVALDVVRMLARSADELRDTDVPEHVLGVLDRSAIRDIHLLIRRGPADAKFTPAELFQLGELTDADVVVHNGGADIDDPATATDNRVRANLETLRAFAGAGPGGRRRTIHLRFRTAAVEVQTADRQVTGLLVEGRTPGADGSVDGSGDRTVLDAQLVVSAVGFRGTPLPGLPFDSVTGTVPHVAGRVHRSGQPLPGVYVAGWLKRGPTGVIGTNKPCGNETAASVLADLTDLPDRELPDLLDLLAARGIARVDWEGWLRLAEHEAALGAAGGRKTAKVPDLESMLKACRAG